MPNLSTLVSPMNNYFQTIELMTDNHHKTIEMYKHSKGTLSQRYNNGIEQRMHIRLEGLWPYE